MPRSTFVLRVAVAITCAGVGWSLLRWTGPVFAWLFLDLGWSESAAASVERGAAFALLAAVPLLFVRAGWIAAVWVAAWLAIAAVASRQTATWQAWLAPFAHAARVLAPAALGMWLLRPDARNRGVGEALLVAGVVSTFAAHGVEALMLRPEFVDYLIGAGPRVFGLDVSQGLAEAGLLCIGIVDVAAAILLGGTYSHRRGRRVRVPILVWMALWGFVTALARIVDMGWGNAPEAMIRVAHGAIPLTLLLLIREKQPRAESAEFAEKG